MQTLEPCPLCNTPGNFYECACRDENKVSDNTRPAAPVEGLETVRYEIVETLPSGSTRWKCVEHEHHANTVAQILEHPTVVNALVHRSQAEAIIAAERAEKDRLAGIASEQTARAEKSEADNAALTARLEKITGSLSNVIMIEGAGHYVNDAVAGHAKTLETQLAAARKALEFISGIGFVAAKDAPAHNDEAVNVARAALEAKP